MQRIAVIGSGIGGLAAAWLLGRRHQVTLYERHPTAGMGAHTLEVEGVRLDVPLRVIYPSYYPTVLQLYRDAGIETAPVDYSVSFTDPAGATYFRYRNLRLGRLTVSVLPLRLRSLAPTALRIVADLLRFYARARRDLSEAGLADLTLGDYLRRRRFSSAFVDQFFLPTFAGIGTCSYERVRAYPARVVLDYLARREALYGEGVRRAARGTDDVVRRLTARVTHARYGVAVAAVIRRGEQVEVAHEDGPSERYDQVVLATPANHALRLLRDADPSEASALAAIPYERTRVVMHTDARLAPSRRRDWSPVNFRVTPGEAHPMATIWMNAIDPRLRTPRPVFQTWNPLQEPAPETVLADSTFERPFVNAASQSGVAALRELGDRPGARVHFCGSYAADGIPLLESAVASALRVAQRLEATPAWALV